MNIDYAIAVKLFIGLLAPIEAADPQRVQVVLAGEPEPELPTEATDPAQGDAANRSVSYCKLAGMKFTGRQSQRDGVSVVTADIEFTMVIIVGYAGSVNSDAAIASAASIVAAALAQATAKDTDTGHQLDLLEPSFQTLVTENPALAIGQLTIAGTITRDSSDGSGGTSLVYL